MSISQMLLPFMSMMGEMEEKNQEWEDRIFDDLEETRTMPRKMKKRRRRELQIDYSIQQWGKDLLKGKYF